MVVGLFREHQWIYFCVCSPEDRFCAAPDLVRPSRRYYNDVLQSWCLGQELPDTTELAAEGAAGKVSFLRA